MALAGWSQNNVATPSNVSVADQRLTITSRARYGSANIITRVVLLYPGNNVQTISITQSTVAADTTTSSTYDLGGALVLSINAICVDAGVACGEIYYDAYVQSIATSWVTQYLIQGQLASSGSQSLNWQYGNPTTFGAMVGGRPSVATITVANPAAGSDWVYTATAEFIHSIQAVYCTLVTSATVANRTVGLAYVNTSGVASSPNIYLGNSGTVVTASTTTNFLFAPFPATPGALTGTQFIQIPPDVGLNKTSTLKTITSLLQAGDQWSNVTVLARVIKNIA
jgi:hypothetical protein